MPQFRFRAPTQADLAGMEQIAEQGLALYRSFAPAGWEPPADRLELGRPERWWLLAEDAAGTPAGHVVFLPAAEHPHRDPDPALAHLGGLFVRPDSHGAGLAAELLRRASAEARARGYTRGRLYCAAGYARARRFYEREGWSAVGEPFPEPRFGGLELIEYRRVCSSGAASGDRRSSVPN